MLIQDLKPLDSLPSRKDVSFELWPPYRPLEYVADYGIKRFNGRLYPGGDVDANHIRVFVGFFDGVPVAFEWTYPVARFVVVEDWMLDYNYARVCRCSWAEPLYRDWGLETKIYRYLQKYEGSRYDWLQLAGIAVNAHWLQLSEHRMVCSHGGRNLQEHFFNVTMFPEIEPWRTPPCSWLNHPEDIQIMNEPRKKQERGTRLLTERTGTQRVLLDLSCEAGRKVTILKQEDTVDGK